MVTLSLLSAFVVALSLPLSSVAAASHNAPLRRAAHAHNGAIHRRGSNADATWYVINTGQQTACGGFHQPSEWVIAMNQQDFPGSCGKRVTIQWQGKQTTATVVDECGTTGCLNRGIDLTESLFEFFAPKSVGDLSVNWWFADDAPAPPPPPPTTTKAKPPPPTSTYKPPPPPTTTSTSTHTTPTTTSTTHSTTHTTTKSTTSIAPTPTAYSNIAGLYQAVVNIGGVELKEAAGQE